VLLFGDLKNRWVFYLGAAFVFINTYYLAFIIGMLLSDLYNSKDNERYNVNSTVAVCGLLFLGLFCGSYSYVGWWGMGIYNMLNIGLINPHIFFQIIGAGLVILALLNSSIFKHQLSSKVPVFLGRISFTMYLLHLLIVYSVSSILFLALIGLFSYNVATIIVFLVTLPLVLGVSYLAYKYVDAPGIELSKRVYERYFTGEWNPQELVATRKRVVSFAKKNLVFLAAAEVVLLLLIGGMVVIVKPVMDNDRAAQAVTYYGESLNHTIVAYNNLTAYPAFNNTSIGSYRVWLDGYEVRAFDFSSNYYSMKRTGESNKQYYSPELQEKISTEVLFYGNLVNESKNKSQACENVYNEWYWNNTPDIVKLSNST
jgi:hypothetical protein